MVHVESEMNHAIQETFGDYLIDRVAAILETLSAQKRFLFDSGGILFAHRSFPPMASAANVRQNTLAYSNERSSRR